MGRSGYKEPAWWRRALDCLWEIHLVVVQGKVGAVQDSQGAPSAAAQEEEAAQHAAACKNNRLCLCLYLCTLSSAMFALSVICYGYVSNCLCAEM